MSIYDKTVPKPILDILAEMIAVDPALKIGAGAKSSSSRGSDAGSHGIDD
jgi:import receptor subunit TOM20